MKKYRIVKTDNEEYPYNAQELVSVDGNTWNYCGNGKFFKTYENAKLWCRRSELIEHLEGLKKEGYTCYIAPNNKTYGYIVTKDNVLLYVQCNYFAGYDISLPYVPSQENGSGCSCADVEHAGISLGYEVIDTETIEYAKQIGLSFASKLGAKLYRNADCALENVYKFDEYIKL